MSHEPKGDVDEEESPKDSTDMRVHHAVFSPSSVLDLQPDGVDSGRKGVNIISADFPIVAKELGFIKVDA